MKSLSESLFDDDLIEKDINIFNFYSWHWGEVYIVLPNRDQVPLRVALENEFKFDQLFKTGKLNKLPHPKELVERSGDNYILRNVYNTLLTSSIDKLDDRWELGKTVADAVRELIKPKTMGGSTRCDIYPLSRRIKTILDDDVKSILIIDELNFQIGSSLDNTYRLKTQISLRRK